MIAAALISVLTVCEPGATTRTPAEAVDAFMVAYNARDLAGVQAVLSPQARVLAGYGELTGARLMDNYRAVIFVADPPYVLRPLQQLNSGDLVAQTEAYTGGYTGAFTGLTVYRVEGGCIVEMSVNR